MQESLVGEKGNGRRSELVPQGEVLVTVAELSRQLRVSEGWIRDHASGRRRPVLPSIKLGRVRRFRQRDVQRFLDASARLGEELAA